MSILPDLFPANADGRWWTAWRIRVLVIYPVMILYTLDMITKSGTVGQWLYWGFCMVLVVAETIWRRWQHATRTRS